MQIGQKVVGNAHPPHREVLGRESGTETILSRPPTAEYREKGEKRMEVLVLDQSYYAPSTVMWNGAKPYLMQEQPYNQITWLFGKVRSR